MSPDQMNYALTAALFLLGAGAVHLWRKGDDRTDNFRKELIEVSTDLAQAGWTVCSAVTKNLAAGDIKQALSEAKKGAEIARDPVLRLNHTGDMTMANINDLLKDPKFGPQIRAKVKQQDVLIKSEETNVSEPV